MSPEEARRRRLDREKAAEHFWSIANITGLITRIASAVSRELIQPLDPFKPREIEGESARPQLTEEGNHEGDKAS